MFSFFCIYTQVELLDHMVFLLLIFLRKPYTMAAPIYIPTNGIQVIPKIS